jgi:predicted metal-dependent peptidase
MKRLPDPVVEAISNLIIREEFIAHFLMNKLYVHYEPTTPTAATDGRHIFVGDWFCQLPILERVFTMAHEVLHCILEHTQRSKTYREHGHGPDMKPFSHDKANVAQDYVINDILRHDGIGKMPSIGLHSSKFTRGMTWDEVYIALDGTGGLSSMDEHRDPSATDAMSSDEIKQAVVQAYNAARLAGRMPGGLKRLCDDLLNPQQPWQDLLRDFFMRMAGKEEDDWTRVNRRRMVAIPNVPAPGRTGYTMGDVAVNIDVSGSISTEVLTQFISELRGIIDQVRPRNIHLIMWDGVAHYQLVKELDDLERIEIVGGGGTNYDCAIEMIEEMGLEPEVVVCMTDGYVHCTHDAVPYPHITVTTAKELPFGRNVMMQ